MKPVRFVMAFPRGPAAARLPVLVESPAQVCCPVPALWHDAGTPCLDLPGLGLILGVAFSRRTHRLLDRACELTLPGQGAEAAARQILRGIWGGYLAILIDPAARACLVLRDASALLPVYRVETAHHTCLTTDPALLAQVPGARTVVSDPAVWEHLAGFALSGLRTCLDGLEELPPGSLSDLAWPDAPSRQIWKPSDHFPQGPVPGFGDAAQRLRELSIEVLGAWNAALGPVSVAASGGVDSSLICAALSRAGAPYDCINVATLDRSGDESVYARQTAMHLGVGCTERSYDPALFDPCVPASLGLPRPSRRAFVRVLDLVLADARDELGTRMVFDGNGGDNLFCFLHSAAPVVDRLRHEGVTAGTLGTLLDMCRITGCSAPVMARATARRLMARRSDMETAPDTSLLDRKWLQEADWSGKPDRAAASGPRSGSLDHAALIAQAGNQIHGLASPLARFSPLASQPLVEFCLSIPTWLWARGGLNRALARAAFASDLPPQILARTSKAGPDSFIREAFVHNRARIGERLLGGYLSDRGILDRLAVEQALSVDVFRDTALVDRLLDLLEAENWARSWAG